MESCSMIHLIKETGKGTEAGRRTTVLNFTKLEISNNPSENSAGVQFCGFVADKRIVNKYQKGIVEGK